MSEVAPTVFLVWQEARVGNGYKSYLQSIFQTVEAASTEIARLNCLAREKQAYYHHFMEARTVRSA